MTNYTIFTHFHSMKNVFVLVFQKITLNRGITIYLPTLNRGSTVYLKWIKIVFWSQKNILINIYPYTGKIRSTRLLGSNTLPCQSPISIEHVYLIYTIIWSTRVSRLGCLFYLFRHVILIIRSTFQAQNIKCHYYTILSALNLIIMEAINHSHWKASSSPIMFCFHRVNLKHCYAFLNDLKFPTDIRSRLKLIKDGSTTFQIIRREHGQFWWRKYCK